MKDARLDWRAHCNADGGEDRPEDVDKVDAEDGIGGDDAADALRSMVATKPRVIIQGRLRGL